jgi:hypothetical protein
MGWRGLTTEVVHGGAQSGRWGAGDGSEERLPVRRERSAIYSRLLWSSVRHRWDRRVARAVRPWWSAQW